LKRITESVSQFYETDYVIRLPYILTFFRETVYVKFWNGCRNVFLKRFVLFVWNGMWKLFYSF